MIVKLNFAQSAEMVIAKAFSGVKKSEGITTNQILAALRSKHESSEWAVFEELSSSVGYSPRRIDLFAISCWASRGLMTISYEVKVSRQDFAKEMETPEKRASAESVSSEFWFVTPHGLVSPDEVPENCGLLYCNQNLTLSKKKIAQQRRVKAI